MEDSQEEPQGVTREEFLQLQDELKSANSKIDEWAGRAKRAEKKLKSPEEKAVPEKQAPSSDGLTREEARLMFEKKYSLDEVDIIKSFAKSNSLSITEAESHPFVTAGIKGAREQAKVEAATPAPSNRARSQKAKTFSQMSESERREHFSLDAWKARKQKANKTR
jgi:hypothetical protein